MLKPNIQVNCRKALENFVTNISHVQQIQPIVSRQPQPLEQTEVWSKSSVEKHFQNFVVNISHVQQIQPIASRQPQTGRSWVVSKHNHIFLLWLSSLLRSQASLVMDWYLLHSDIALQLVILSWVYMRKIHLHEDKRSWWRRLRNDWELKTLYCTRHFAFDNVCFYCY